MGLDARLRYTRMVIKNSFVELLKDKPINKITVKELCDRAEINRATFYKHYLDIYDLLDKIEEQFLNDLKKNLVSTEQRGISDTLSLIMVSIKAEADMYMTLFSDNGDPTFPKKVFEMCYQIDQIMDGVSIEGQFSDVKKKWFYNYLAYGCNGIITQWIAEGMKEPISEVVNFTEQLIKNSLVNIKGDSKN